MKKPIKIETIRIIQALLIFGIIYLAANDKEGWGWLVFLFYVSL